MIYIPPYINHDFGVGGLGIIWEILILILIIISIYIIIQINRNHEKLTKIEKDIEEIKETTKKLEKKWEEIE
ncbi:hypothetical protein ACPB8Q_03010 [Methanocaldococcus indicus]|uniref:hypothetical protein n=1 Tax=Methanocaldococcus indicus TaxID=213231 RepID=UPI003C6D6D5D